MPTIGKRGDEATSCLKSSLPLWDGGDPDGDAGGVLLRLAARRTDDRDVGL